MRPSPRNIIAAKPVDAGLTRREGATKQSEYPSYARVQRSEVSDDDMAAEIIKCERVSHPPVRFIGKRYEAYPNWNDFWENDWFTKIEAAGKTAEINDDSYCVLTGMTPLGMENYLGEFFPAETPVPEGFDFVDLPAMEAALFFIKGHMSECYGMAYSQELLRAEMVKCGITPPEEQGRWISFERDNCPRWTDPDEQDRRILDFAIYLD